MYYYNPKTKQTCKSIEAAEHMFCKNFNCYENRCPIEEHNDEITCTDYIKNNPIKAAQLMGYEVIYEVIEEDYNGLDARWVNPHWRNSTSCADCSACGVEVYHIKYQGVQQYYKFCPFCGSKIDRGD